MNYSVTGEQLTGIADAIRAKVDIDPSEPYASLGKNILNPNTMEVEGLPDGHYTFSMKALEASGSGMFYEWTYGTQPIDESIPAHEAGERVSFLVNVAAEVRLSFPTATGFTDYQLESGDEATDYEPYAVKITFPDGFVGGIGEIVPAGSLTKKTVTLSTTVSTGNVNAHSYVSKSLSGSIPNDIALKGFFGYTGTTSGIPTSLQNSIGKPSVGTTQISVPMILYNLTGNTVSLANRTLTADFYYYAYPSDES